jgi:nucleotide-binding universal stress UspA family protein
MFQRILVPLDGSALAEHALGYAADMAPRYGARLVLLRAFDGPQRSAWLLAQFAPVDGGILAGPGVTGHLTTAVLEAEADVRAYLEGHRRRLLARGLAVDTLVVDAGASDAILQEAQREPATVIVMSTHGRGGLGRLIFGSTAQDVLRRSPVPLLLVRAGMPVGLPAVAEHGALEGTRA